MSIAVRPAAPEDAEALLRVKARSWREAYGALLPPEVFERAEARVPQEAHAWAALIGTDRELWVAEDDGGRLVGMALAGPSGREGEGLPARRLMALYVLAEAHGTGVGARLLDAVVGDGPAVLDVLAENPRARAFYTKHGFVDEGPPEPMDGAWAGLHEQRMVRRG